jgi:hypothetical protein
MIGLCLMAPNERDRGGPARGPHPVPRSGHLQRRRCARRARAAAPGAAPGYRAAVRGAAGRLGLHDRGGVRRVFGHRRSGQDAGLRRDRPGRGFGVVGWRRGHLLLRRVDRARDGRARLCRRAAGRRRARRALAARTRVSGLRPVPHTDPVHRPLAGHRVAAAGPTARGDDAVGAGAPRRLRAGGSATCRAQPTACSSAVSSASRWSISRCRPGTLRRQPTMPKASLST